MTGEFLAKLRRMPERLRRLGIQFEYSRHVHWKWTRIHVHYLLRLEGATTEAELRSAVRAWLGSAFTSGQGSPGWTGFAEDRPDPDTPAEPGASGNARPGTYYLDGLGDDERAAAYVAEHTRESGELTPGNFQGKGCTFSREFLNKPADDLWKDHVERWKNQSPEERAAERQTRKDAAEAKYQEWLKNQPKPQQHPQLPPDVPRDANGWPVGSWAHDPSTCHIPGRPMSDDAADWLAAHDAQRARDAALDSLEWIAQFGRTQRDAAGRIVGQWGYDPETGGEPILDARNIPQGWRGHDPETAATVTPATPPPAARPPRRPPPRHGPGK